MMLVQKQPTFSLSHPAPFAHHRRMPSAPVVVQATRTPGLLSLSKPQPVQRPLPQRVPSSNQRHNIKGSPKPKQAQVARAPLWIPAEFVEKNTPNAAVHVSPSPQPRGRAPKNPKDKLINTVKRSASHSSLRGKHGRQPSPPIQQDSSQAEVPPSIQSNIFDPFLDDSQSSPPRNIPTVPSAPALASRPSGKLARRRQQQQASSATPALVTPPATPTPSHAKAIPVPKRTVVRQPQTVNQVSRSDPVLSHMPARPRVHNKRGSVDVFPICDDLTDAGDMSEVEPTTPPATPTRKPAPSPATYGYAGYEYTNAPLTAPLSSRNPAAFPFNVHHSPSPASHAARKPARRNHKRAPSEGVFNMSSDEELSTGPGGSILNPSVQALFGLVRTPAHVQMSTTPPSSHYSYAQGGYPSPFSTPVPARAVPAAHHGAGGAMSAAEREAELEKEAEREVKGYFASSLFQNSPSPEELPDPVFL
ncbi:hypothetical protein BDQ12DRAFT_666364 [Crucibulum laeve]|uniref:Uncharacterized protein n=1 Tax=Crucibulum laeve TaxID=68775 RepID=A0A5C3M022_9AGAR|nr:hypothetical protein BDQ12DRAFT_666364 [Crucibulum laeve]